MVYHSHGLKLTENQKKTIRDACVKNAPVSIRLSKNQLSGPDQVLMTATQLKKIHKGNGMMLKISKAQVRKVGSGLFGNIGNWFRKTANTVANVGRNVGNKIGSVGRTVGNVAVDMGKRVGNKVVDQAKREIEEAAQRSIIENLKRYGIPVAKAGLNYLVPGGAPLTNKLADMAQGSGIRRKTSKRGGSFLV